MAKIEFSKSEITIFSLGLLISLIAKGAALFPLSYSTDDFGSMIRPINTTHYLSQGRFGEVLAKEMLQSLGAVPPLANILFVFIGLVSIILVGILICRLWKISDNIILSFLVVSFIAIHPYQAEIFTFKTASLFGLTLLMAFISLYFSELKIKTMLWTTLSVAFALSIYQLVLNYIFLVLCFTLLLEMASSNIGDKKDWKVILDNVKFWPRLLTITSGTIIYIILNKIVQLTFNIEPINRGQFINLNELPDRAIQACFLLSKIFIKSEPIVPSILKILLGILAILSIFSILRSILHSDFNKNEVYKLILIGLLIVITSFSIVGILLPIKVTGLSSLKDWYLSSRVLSAIGIFWAGILVLAYKNLAKKGKILIVTISLVIIFGFIGINNHIFTDQLRMNMRDLYKANRIIARLEENSEFSQIKTIVVLNHHQNYPSKIKTNFKDMNISALSAPWSKLNLLREVSGYDFSDPTDEDNKIAEEYCRESKKWPDPTSVTIKDRIGIICF